MTVKYAYDATLKSIVIQTEITLLFDCFYETPSDVIAQVKIMHVTAIPGYATAFCAHIKGNVIYPSNNNGIINNACVVYVCHLAATF